ncbi:MAG: hypothetical protein ACE5FG_13930, partial [Myxococcota bacterium]
FLASASRRHFLRWLGESFPELRPLYGELFSSGIDVDPAWSEALRRRVARIREQLRVPAAPEPGPAQRSLATTQLLLPGLAAGG